MKNKLKRVAAEPSSWAGLAAVLQAVSMAVPQYGAVVGVLTAICGAVAVAKREGGAP